MERYRKKDMLQTVDTLLRANDAIVKTVRSNPQGAAEVLVQCQESAIALGTYIDTLDEKYADLVHILEDYCENIYQMNESLSDENTCRKVSKKIQKQLTGLQNNIKYDLPEDRKEIVFLPYKASMWDSLESVWKAADADPDCDAYVIPIPYFDKNPDGSFREEHYEGDQYPAYVPVTRYDEYDLEARRPDVIYIHNPYDECNHVTSVHPYFYSKNLRNFTDKLVYIPYFILGEIEPDNQAAIDGMKHFCFTPGTIYAHQVIVQSENMRQIYINEYIKAAKEMGLPGEHVDRKFLEKKFLGTGSPKIDKVLNTKKEDLEIPAEWLKVIEKPDGSWKKIVFYNTSVSALLQHGEKMLRKMEAVFEIFKENQDEVALLWRPHPLIQATVESMRPGLWEAYKEIKNKYIAEGWGIYDDTADMDRAVVLSDAYYGDGSSVVALYKRTSKPILIQDVDAVGEPSVAMCNGVRVGSNWYFVSIKDDILYKMDLKTFKVEYIHYMPHINELYLTRMGYTKLISYKDKLILLPDLSKYIAIYHISKNEITYVDFGAKENIVGACFNGEAVLGDLLYLIPCQFDRIVVLNMETEEIEENRCIELPCVGKGYTDLFSWGSLIQEKENVIFTSLTQNKIFQVNLRTKQVNNLNFDNGESLGGIVKAGSFYWLFPRKGSKIIKLDKEGMIVQTISDFPPGYVDEEESFHMQCDMGDEIVLLPRLANKLLRMNKSTGEIREINVDIDGYDAENYWDHYSRYSTIFQWENKKILVEAKTGKWSILNEKFEVIDSVKLDIEQDANGIKEVCDHVKRDYSPVETDGPIINIKNYIEYVKSI